MKKFLLSVFAAAMAMGANAKNDIYLSMEDQTDVSTDNFKRIAVSVVVENDDPVCNFDANIQLPSPLTCEKFCTKWDEDNEEYVDDYTVASRVNSNQKFTYGKYVETNRALVSVTSNDPTKKSGLLKGTSGVVATVYFDGSSLTTGEYDILLNSDNSSSESDKNYETFLATPDGTNAEGKPKTAHLISEVKKSFKFYFDKENGTVKAVAAPTAKVTIYEADGTSHDEDYDFSTPYVPVENSLLVTTDPRVTGKNVVISGVCAELVIDDTYGFYTPVDFTATKATYNRSVDAGKVVTACLPFAVPAADLNAEAYTLSSFDGADLHYTASATGMEANKPYVLRNTAAGQLVAEVANAAVKKTPTEMEVAADGATHFGLLNEGNFVSKVEFDYYAYVGGKFVRVINLTVPAYRTAIKLLTGTAIGGLKAGSLNELGIIFEGEETGVELIEAENGKVNVYDALGRAIRLNVEASEAVEGLKDGVYMVNGKKVIIRNK